MKETINYQLSTSPTQLNNNQTGTTAIKQQPDPHRTPNMSSEDPSSALTFQEISDLNTRKLQIKASHSSYVQNHPEIKAMLNDFMSAVLLDKPDDVFEFAKDHFAELSPEHANVVGAAGYQPVVVCGPSGVGKGELLWLLLTLPLL